MASTVTSAAFALVRHRGNDKAVPGEFLGFVAAFAQGVDDVMLRGLPGGAQRLADIAGSNDRNFYGRPRITIRCHATNIES